MSSHIADIRQILENPTEQVSLLREVMDACYEAFDSWELDDLGAHLAYLVMAVVDGKIDSFVQWETCPHWNCSTYKTRKFFEKLFPEDHRIWFFIIPLYRGDIPSTDDPV